MTQRSFGPYSSLLKFSVSWVVKGSFCTHLKKKSDLPLLSLKSTQLLPCFLLLPNTLRTSKSRVGHSKALFQSHLCLTTASLQVLAWGSSPKEDIHLQETLSMPPKNQESMKMSLPPLPCTILFKSNSTQTFWRIIVGTGEALHETIGTQSDTLSAHFLSTIWITLTLLPKKA